MALGSEARFRYIWITVRRWSEGVAVSWDPEYLHWGQYFLLLEGPVILGLTCYPRQLSRNWDPREARCITEQPPPTPCAHIAHNLQESGSWIGFGITIWTTLSFLCFTLYMWKYINSPCMFEWRRKQVGFLFGIQCAHPSLFHYLCLNLATPINLYSLCPAQLDNGWRDILELWKIGFGI